MEGENLLDSYIRVSNTSVLLLCKLFLSKKAALKDFDTRGLGKIRHDKLGLV